MTPKEHYAAATDAFESWWAERTPKNMDGRPDNENRIASLKETCRSAFLAGWGGGLENGMADGANILLDRLGTRTQ